MFKMLVSVFAAGLLMASDCRAQFLDTFDGDALAPHWSIPPFNALTHHVSDGLLVVTDLPWPSNPKSPTNFAATFASFPPVSGDFDARAVVGWDPGQMRELRWSVGTTLGHLVASISYGETSNSIRVDRGSGPSLFFAAPAPGMHEFAISRESDTIHTFLNGGLLASFPAATLDPVHGVELHFNIVFPNPGVQPMYVDLVEVVPGPGAASLLLAGVAAGIRRRR